jgi:hypothetical protein
MTFNVILRIYYHKIFNEVKMNRNNVSHVFVLTNLPDYEEMEQCWGL